MYSVPPDLRVRVAVHQIKGAAARWTQAVESKLKRKTGMSFAPCSWIVLAAINKSLCFGSSFVLNNQELLLNMLNSSLPW